MTDEINTKFEKDILAVIKKHEILRFDHIFGVFYKCSRATAYNHNLHKLDSIKEVLEQNRFKNVNVLLKDWIKSKNPVLQIAAMRLICTEEEHRLLNQQYIENKVKVDISDDYRRAIEKAKETNDGD